MYGKDRTDGEEYRRPHDTFDEQPTATFVR